MRTITLNEQKIWLQKRKAELGYADDHVVACNSGTRRTEEKRGLLRRLADISSTSQSALKFLAKF